MRISIDVNEINSKILADKLNVVLHGSRKLNDNKLISDLIAIFSPYLESVLDTIPIEKVLVELLNSESVKNLLKEEAAKYGVNISTIKGE